MKMKMMKKKMEMEVRIISSENIKPSRPTPPHLKSQQLSLLHQLFTVFEYRTPSVLFYAAAPTGSGSIVSPLRDSLSKTLSLFYPLAGRISPGASTIDCSDEGAPFIFAEVNCSLSAFLGAPNRVELVPRFLPTVHPEAMVSGLVPLILQINVFDCGGVAIGAHVLHKIIDGTSRTHFFRTWSAFAAGRESEVVAPDFETAVSLFPPCPTAAEKTAVQVLRPIEGGAGECVAKAFRFSADSIRALQANARSVKVPYPTRVESVSGFIWKHVMAAAVVPGPSIVIHSVDMRPHLRPPLPPSTYGKFTTYATARYANYPDQPSAVLTNLVAILHQGISDAKDFNRISKFVGEGEVEAVCQYKQKLDQLRKEDNVSAYIFTSWGGLDLDFGFGKPLWIGFTGGPMSSWFRNFVPLIQTPGYGIEAWVILDEQEMGNLESNPEFLAFASPCSSSTSIFAPRSSL